jgi:hypothetical protein
VQCRKYVRWSFASSGLSFDTPTQNTSQHIINHHNLRVFSSKPFTFSLCEIRGEDATYRFEIDRKLEKECLQAPVHLKMHAMV